MDNSLDPYHVWLGIPKSEQPCDYYRLLGLAKFESDPRVIEVAADKQMAHIRTFQARHPDESTALLNELAQARNCLLNDDQRLAYDQQLRPAAVATPLVAPEMTSPNLTPTLNALNSNAPDLTETNLAAPNLAAMEMEAPATVRVRPAGKPKRRSRKQRANTMFWQSVIVGGAGVLIALLLVWFAFMRGPSAEVANNAGEVANSAGDKQGASGHAKTPTTPKGQTPAKENVKQQPQPGKQDAANRVNPLATQVPNKPPSRTELAGNPSNLNDSGHAAGLRMISFGRAPSQKGNNGYVKPAALGAGADTGKIAAGIRKWFYDAGTNTVAIGFLKVEQPGEYVFHAYNYYDRSALFIGTKLVCPYRGSVRGGTSEGGVQKSKERIVLEPGLVPIAAIGYVDARGSVEVSWCPPGQDALSEIPPELLWHSPSTPLNSGAEAWAFLGGKPHAASATASPTTPPSSNGAVLTVKRMKPMPADDPPLPELVGGTHFKWASKPKTLTQNGVAEFEVLETGHVYLVASWPETEYQGRKGAWFNQRQTKDSLIKQGWEHLGKWPANSKRSVFRKLCAKGETYSIRTNKYWPPDLFCPPR